MIITDRPNVIIAIVTSPLSLLGRCSKCAYPPSQHRLVNCNGPLLLASVNLLTDYSYASVHFIIGCAARYTVRVIC